MAFAVRQNAASGLRGQAKRASGRTRSVAVTCIKGDARPQNTAQYAAAALAASIILSCSSAEAGVVLAKPSLKKAFFDDTPVEKPAPRKLLLPGSSAPAPKAAAPKVESSEGGGFEIDPRAVALPGAIALLGAGTFAATNIDKDFDWESAWVKNSNVIALGYEPAIKEGGIPFKVGGTKKVKASKKGKK